MGKVLDITLSTVDEKECVHVFATQPGRVEKQDKTCLVQSLDEGEISITQAALDKLLSQPLNNDGTELRFEDEPSIAWQGQDMHTDTPLEQVYVSEAAKTWLKEKCVVAGDAK